MSTRYLTNMITALFGGFIVVESLTISHPAERWVAFAFGIGVVALTAVATLDRARGLMQRALDVFLMAIGGAMIAISVIFTGSTAMWVDFALALGWVGTSVIGLTAHEVASWRTMHGMAELHPFVPARRLKAQQPVTQPATGTRVA